MINAIQSRRSVRRFKNDPVTKEQLEQLLEAAMLAPSAHNTRPWEFIAVTQREMLDKFSVTHPNAKMFLTATAGILVVGIQRPEMPEGYFSQDCAAATQNILLQAADIGLGTCWCGVYPRPERVSAFSELLDIREPKFPFGLIAIGVPNESTSQKGFYDQSKVTFIE